MRILFDQGTPVPLRRFLTDHDVATAYGRLVTSLRHPPPLCAHPIASVTLVRLADARAELFQLGDCPAFVVGEDSRARRATINKANPRAAESATRVEAAQAAVGHSAKAVWADLLPSLQREREALLGASPMRASAPIAGAAFAGYSASFDLPGVGAVALMSDGYERFSAIYRLGDDARMGTRTLAEGPERLLAELRAAEAGDPDCRRYPRLKPSDDATCLVIGMGA